MILFYEFCRIFQPNAVKWSHNFTHFSGTKRNSRIEFQTLPGNPRADFKFTFGFKTYANNSIIFYASSGTHNDYITFYIKDGKVRDSRAS